MHIFSVRHDFGVSWQGSGVLKRISFAQLVRWSLLRARWSRSVLPLIWRRRRGINERLLIACLGAPARGMCWDTATYVNPHDGAVRALLAGLVADSPDLWSGRVLDLACGSGEATLALVAAGVSPGSIDACDPYTLDAFRARVSAELLGPSTAPPGGNRKKQSSGSRASGRRGSQPVAAYPEAEPGIYGWSFEDVSAGALQEREYTTVVCSFALHLCEPS